MAENNAQATTLDDIIFADRNKAYGAYDLRKVYRPTLTKSMLIGGALFLLAMLAPTLISLIPDSTQELNMQEVDLMKMPPPPIDPNEPPPPPPPPVEQPKVASVKFLPPEVKTDPPEEVPPPEMKDMEKKVVSNIDQEGVDESAAGIAEPTELAPEKKEVKIAEVEAPSDQIFQVVEQNPEFPGGSGALNSYLAKNIKYPAGASRANVSGKVFLTFTVNTDGSIQDVQVLKGLGFGCDEEAVRVVKSMPKWRPGRQSGRPVRVKYNLPVSFVLE